jgi:hypothetical protein
MTNGADSAGRFGKLVFFLAGGAAPEPSLASEDAADPYPMSAGEVRRGAVAIGLSVGLSFRLGQLAVLLAATNTMDRN